MNKLLRILILNSLVCSLLFICSCQTVKNSNEFEKTTDTVNDIEIKKTIRLKLESEFNLKVNNPITTITLYGFDKMLGDVGASIIVEKEVDLTELTRSIDIELPNKPASLIDPKITAKENAKYYIAVYCDNNNNGKEDKGDLKINFDKGFPYVNIDSEETQVLYIKEL